VTTDDPRGWRLGGGVTYASLTTARLGLRTAAMIGLDATTATASELTILRDAGADLLVVPLAEGPIYQNVETAEGRIQTCVQVGVPMPVPSLPSTWDQARGWQLAPVADELDDRWADVVPAGALLAVGWQGLLRDLVAGRQVARRPPRPSPILRRADIVALSHRDVGMGTPIERLIELLSPGARLIVTHGGHGGSSITVGAAGASTIARYRPARPSDERDPTGAGDAFLAALLATLVDPTLLGPVDVADHHDLRVASAVAGLVVEGVGLEAVPSRAAVADRLARDAAIPIVAAAGSGATIAGRVTVDQC
jgi:sugar/nucleoside kinase (ribokinase family)